MAISISEIDDVAGTEPIQTAVFSESSDAGETLATATSLVTQQMTPLTTISGSLSGDADLFQVFLTGGQTFSATTTSARTAEIPVNQALRNPD